MCRVTIVTAQLGYIEGTFITRTRVGTIVVRSDHGGVYFVQESQCWFHKGSEVQESDRKSKRRKLS